MLSNHPFSWIPAGRARRLVLLVLAVAVVGTFLAVRASSAALVGEGTRCTIVSLELAGSPERAREVVEAWQSRGVLGAAIRNVWLDYPFLIAYSTALALATGMASDVLQGWTRWRRIGLLLAWGALAAGGFDAIENLGLLHLLGAPGHVEGTWSWLTAACATMKFALVVAALLHAIAGGLAWTVSRIEAALRG